MSAMTVQEWNTTPTAEADEMAVAFARCVVRFKLTSYVTGTEAANYCAGQANVTEELAPVLVERGLAIGFVLQTVAA